MKKKCSTNRKRIDAKIREAKTINDKHAQLLNGVSYDEWRSEPTRLARYFFELRGVNWDELRARVKRQMQSGTVSVDTETEWGALQSSSKMLYRFTLTAMQRWQPESLEKLAKAMRRIARHKTIGAADVLLRSRLIINSGKGNVKDLANEFYPKEKLESAMRKVSRVKARLFPKSKKDS